MRSTRICAFLVLAFLARPLPGLEVRLGVPAGLQETWQKLTAEHPLPEGVQIVNQGESASLSLEAFRGAAPEAPGDWKVVRRTILAPVGRLGAKEPDEGRVLPLESITLPLVALPADGLFPDQPGYPLIEKVALILEGADPGLQEWFENVSDAQTAAPDGSIAWIGAVGDIMPARGVDALLAKTGGLEKVFGDTLPVLGSCGLLLGNLEGTATRRGTRATKSFTFRFDPDALSRLAEAGFTYLSLANNHSFDFGEAGFLDTLDALAGAGIGTSGAGANEEQARAVLETRVDGTAVRILSFGAYPVDRMGFDGRRTARAAGGKAGILWLDEQSVASAARQFGPDTFDIVMVHGGEEWTRAPTARQRALCLQLVEAGADLVTGTHPHVLQPLEAVDGRLIAWSLGNFLCPGMDGTPGGEDSAILRVGVYRGAVRYVQMVPIRLEGTSVRLAAPSQVAESARGGVSMGDTEKGDTR
jgi:hypothetical protein